MMSRGTEPNSTVQHRMSRILFVLMVRSIPIVPDTIIMSTSCPTFMFRFAVLMR
jgi:hypothetical protein